MATKPRADLATLAGISKAEASATVPFGGSQQLDPRSPAKPTSLTVMLEGDDYAALRAHCLRHELATGKRLTHREVMVTALRAYLDNHSI